MRSASTDLLAWQLLGSTVHFACLCLPVPAALLQRAADPAPDGACMSRWHSQQEELGGTAMRSVAAHSLPAVDLQGAYYEAVVQDIDPTAKTLVACFPDDVGMSEACFQLEYDILILGPHLSARRRGTHLLQRLRTEYLTPGSQAPCSHTPPSFQGRPRQPFRKLRRQTRVHGNRRCRLSSHGCCRVQASDLSTTRLASRV